MLAVSKRKEETHELLRRCFEANVFFQDLKMKTSIKLAQIGMIYQQDAYHFNISLQAVV